jgi:hypothetical protein
MAAPALVAEVCVTDTLACGQASRVTRAGRGLSMVRATAVCGALRSNCLRWVDDSTGPFTSRAGPLALATVL